MFASIPSPSSGSIELGPLTFRAYGLMIALGVLAAVALFGKRLAQRGYSTDHATGMAMWAVPAGLVGARAYHVITDWKSFRGNWGEAFEIWQGGLGILGGVIAGFCAALVYARKHDVPLAVLLGAGAPALPLAQAIGRWGNWFNQELFGRPSDLPWALEIDTEYRPSNYVGDETFHPTFFYESLWNLGLLALLLRIDKSRRLKPFGLFAGYLAGYSVGRLWIEAIRIDTASQLGGLRVNLWVFLVVLVASLFVVVKSLRSSDEMAALAPDAELDDGGGGGHLAHNVDDVQLDHELEGAEAD